MPFDPPERQTKSALQTEIDSTSGLEEMKDLMSSESERNASGKSGCYLEELEVWNALCFLCCCCKQKGLLI